MRVITVTVVFFILIFRFGLRSLFAFYGLVYSDFIIVAIIPSICPTSPQPPPPKKNMCHYSHFCSLLFVCFAFWLSSFSRMFLSMLVFYYLICILTGVFLLDRSTVYRYLVRSRFGLALNVCIICSVTSLLKWCLLVVYKKLSSFQMFNFTFVLFGLASHYLSETIVRPLAIRRIWSYIYQENKK